MLGEMWNLIIPISTDDASLITPQPANDLILKHWYACILNKKFEYKSVSTFDSMTVIVLKALTASPQPAHPGFNDHVLSTWHWTQLADTSSSILWCISHCSTTQYHGSFKQCKPESWQILLSNFKTYLVLQYWDLLYSKLSLMTICLPAACYPTVKWKPFVFALQVVSSIKNNIQVVLIESLSKGLPSFIGLCQTLWRTPRTHPVEKKLLFQRSNPLPVARCFYC